MIQRNGARGFTLLELLMVVIIIAILASIALPQYLRIAERSRASGALTVLAAIRSSEMRYRAGDNANSYTTNLNSLDIDGPGPAAGPWTTALWAFNVTGTGGGSNSAAKRVAGPQTGKLIQIDLDQGGVCSDAPNAYGIPAAAPGCP